MRFASLVTAGLAALASAIVLVSACASSEDLRCEINSDCQLGFYCDDEGACAQDCVDAERDCPRGYACNSIGQCEFGGEGGGSSGPGAGGAGSTTSTTNTATGTATSTGTGTTGDGIELDICFGDAECASPLSCERMHKNGTQRCTRACTTHAECPGGMRCEDTGSGDKACVMSDVGRPCAAADACHFGCLNGPGHCTSSCTTGADCPNGWGCMEVANQRVCVQAAAYCDGVDNSACIVDAACDLSPTMIVGSCTLACDTAADCPRRAAGLAAWTCDGAGICRRPGDVYGPLPGGTEPAQYACNASSTVVNLCNDAQHIDFDAFTIPNPPSVDCGSATTTDGANGDACVDSCRYQGGCPYGFGCTAVGGVAGGRIGLCLPVGLGEVGNACARDGDCAFAYCNAGTCSRDCTDDGLCPTGSTCVAGSAPNVEGLPFRRCE